jgi:DNA-binding NarL/FixJ family response regulator
MNNQATQPVKVRLRILLADDHKLVREGLRMLVDSQPDMEVIAEASDGAAALQHAKELQPDIAVLDISMPKINGLEATKRLKQVCPDVKVITLTRHNETGYLKQLLTAGASGYVLKQSASAELIRAIRTVADGTTYLDPAITSKVVEGYIERPEHISKKSYKMLSEREEEVLRLIAWGYSNKEIAAKLNISVKTVEAHKANSLKKIGLISRIDIVRYALLRGWLNNSES